MITHLRAFSRTVYLIVQNKVIILLLWKSSWQLFTAVYYASHFDDFLISLVNSCVVSKALFISLLPFQKSPTHKASDCPKNISHKTLLFLIWCMRERSSFCFSWLSIRHSTVCDTFSKSRSMFFSNISFRTLTILFISTGRFNRIATKKFFIKMKIFILESQTHNQWDMRT